MAQFATAAAPALDLPPVTVNLEEPPVIAEHKMAEVATFPSPSPVASAKPQTPKLAEAPNRNASSSRRTDSSPPCKESYSKPPRKPRKRR